MSGENADVQSGGVARREFLIELAALGTAAFLPQATFAAQPRAAASHRLFRIDVHHHFAPPQFIAEVIARDAGNPAIRKWTPQASLEEMDKAGVSTAFLSITRPGVWFGDIELARKLARDSNDFAARMLSDHPKRFGLFATLPLPDVDGTLREIEYSLDTLKADGIAVMSSYEGKYLGDPAFMPVMDELNRRKAIVYEHPLREDRENPLNGIELVTDTTRTIASLLYTATVVRFPDIRFIFSHAGGTIASVTGRMDGIAEKLPKGLIYQLQKFYYDTAQAFNPYILPSFRKLVPVSHILFGTDFPLGAGIESVAKGLRDNGAFSASDLRAIERENALALFPRLKTANGRESAGGSPPPGSQ